MGFLDRLFGTEPQRQKPPVPPYGNPQYVQPEYSTPQPAGRPDLTPPPAGSNTGGAHVPVDEDAAAVERYRYLLRTAPPETIEQVHAEAFGRLTELQRQQVLAELSSGLPPYERPGSTDPRVLARAATRAEYMNPGFMERTLGSRQGGGFGSMVGGSLLGTVAGYVIGSAIVGSFLGPSMYEQGYDDGSADASGDTGAGDTGTDGTGADASDAGDWGGGFDGGGFDGGGFDGGGMDFGGFDGF